jgi:hypothetical protein
MSRENVEIVRRFLVVDDLDESLMDVDPDIVWNPVEESSGEGHDAVRAQNRAHGSVQSSPKPSKP